MDEYNPRSVAEFTRYSSFVGIKVRRHGGGSKLVLPNFTVNIGFPGEIEAWERLIEWFAISELELGNGAHSM